MTEEELDDEGLLLKLLERLELLLELEELLDRLELLLELLERLEREELLERLELEELDGEDRNEPPPLRAPLLRASACSHPS